MQRTTVVSSLQSLLLLLSLPMPSVTQQWRFVSEGRATEAAPPATTKTTQQMTTSRLEWAVKKACRLQNRKRRQ